jgi:hypothetical protein
VMSDECGVMNDGQAAVFNSSLIIPHSSFVSYPVYPAHPC